MSPTLESSFSTIRHPFAKKNIPGQSWGRDLSIALCFKYKNEMWGSDMGRWKTEFSKNVNFEIFDHSKNIFRKSFFQTFFYFRKLHVRSYSKNEKLKKKHEFFRFWKKTGSKNSDFETNDFFSKILLARKIFFENVFRNFFFVFVNYMDIAT